MGEKNTSGIESITRGSKWLDPEVASKNGTLAVLARVPGFLVFDRSVLRPGPGGDEIRQAKEIAANGIDATCPFDSRSSSWPACAAIQLVRAIGVPVRLIVVIAPWLIQVAPLS